MSDVPTFSLGAWLPLKGQRAAESLELPAHHLVTHGVIVGMTGTPGSHEFPISITMEPLGARSARNRGASCSSQ